MNAVLNIGLGWVIFECANPTSMKTTVILILALSALNVVNFLTGYYEGVNNDG